MPTPRILDRRRGGARCGCVESDASRARLRPQLEERVPAAGAKSHAVVRDAEARDAVVVAGEASHLLRRESIPHVAVEIVVAGEEVPAAVGEVDGGDAAKDLVMSILTQLLRRPQVEHPARRVVGARGEGLAVGKEAHSIDVRLVALKCAHRLWRFEVPDLGLGVASTRNEHRLSAVRLHRDGHHISRVPLERANLLPALDVPLHACHVAGGGQDLGRVGIASEEAAAREVPRVSRELPSDLDRLLLARQHVDRANVVEASARDLVARR
mmetsp:Transcript_11632/g.29790  ORF Transcript_11632/g.29790 Transcript_11632/m.29790 type:complete len:269 (-) Transcript_11632:347-1153(-)